MLDNTDIVPGRGIGDILLGMGKADVESILGSPDEKEEINYDDGETSCTYYYFDLKIDFTFESDDNERLSFMSISNEQFLMKGKIKVGDGKESVIKHCKDLEFSESEIEDLSSDDIPNHELIALNDENINFWFTDNKLDEIQIGPFWKDDDTPIWPKS